MSSAYETLRVLGRGSYGTAVLARDRRQEGDELHVLKQVDISDMSEEACQKAQEEVAVLKSLQHVNIVAYHATFVEHGSLFIVMEYADDGTLADSIKRRQCKQVARFSEEEALSIFSQACLALQHVHAKHILHRDLKSQNIFLTKNGTVKLGDFGIAKTLDRTDAEAMTVIGTPSYLAPEVCDSKPYSFKADVWSLGVVLQETLTLELPFVAKSLAALVVKIVTSSPQPVSKGMGTDDTRRLLRSLLRKKPEKRFTVDEILALPNISRMTQLLSDKQARSDSECSTRATSRGTSIDSVSSRELFDKQEQATAEVTKVPAKEVVELWDQRRPRSKGPSFYRDVKKSESIPPRLCASVEGTRLRSALHLCPKTDDNDKELDQKVQRPQVQKRPCRPTCDLEAEKPTEALKCDEMEQSLQAALEELDECPLEKEAQPLRTPSLLIPHVHPPQGSQERPAAPSKLIRRVASPAWQLCTPENYVQSNIKAIRRSPSPERSPKLQCPSQCRLCPIQSPPHQKKHGLLNQLAIPYEACAPVQPFDFQKPPKSLSPLDVPFDALAPWFNLPKPSRLRGRPPKRLSSLVQPEQGEVRSQSVERNESSVADSRPASVPPPRQLPHVQKHRHRRRLFTFSS
jgi:serine/threonine protein kinase